MKISFLILNAYGMGGTIRATFALATKMSERHDVEMAREAQRRLRRRSPGASDHAGSRLSILVVLDAKAPLLEERAGVPRAVALAAGRIDRLEAQQRARQRDSVLVFHAYLIAIGLMIACTVPVMRAGPSVKRNSHAWSFTSSSVFMFSRM